MFLGDFTSPRFMLATLEDIVGRYGSVVASNLINSKPSDLVMKELIGASFTISRWTRLTNAMRARGFSPDFAELDFLDRFFNDNPGSAISQDPTGVLKNHLDNEGKLDYTYGERLHYQWKKIVEELRRNPDTRQAFMSVWNPYIDIDNLGQKRVPCSIGYQFFIRDEKLIMIYMMRSCDVTGCLPNDIYTAARTATWVADSLGISLSYVQFDVMSLHMFIKKEEAGLSE